MEITHLLQNWQICLVSDYPRNVSEVGYCGSAMTHLLVSTLCPYHECYSPTVVSKQWGYRFHNYTQGSQHHHPHLHPKEIVFIYFPILGISVPQCSEKQFCIDRYFGNLSLCLSHVTCLWNINYIYLKQSILSLSEPELRL